MAESRVLVDVPQVLGNGKILVFNHCFLQAFLNRLQGEVVEALLLQEADTFLVSTATLLWQLVNSRNISDHRIRRLDNLLG